MIKSKSDQQVLKLLDKWLGGPQSCMYLTSRDNYLNTFMISKWIIELEKNNSIEITLLPISPISGTSIEREFIQMFFSSFSETVPALFSVPCSLNEYRWIINQTICCDREPEEKVKLIIIDRIDQIFDLNYEKGYPLLDEIGHKTKVLISFKSNNKNQIHVWHRKLNRNDKDTFVLHLPLNLYQSEKNHIALYFKNNGRKLNEQIRKFLDILYVAMAPISLSEIKECFGFHEINQKKLNEIILDGRCCPIVNENDCFKFKNDTVRAEWFASRDENSFKKIEHAFIKKAISLLSSASKEMNISVSEYFVKYLGGHMNRRNIQLKYLRLLVSPVWLNIWLQQQNGIAGYLADVRRVRNKVETELLKSNCQDNNAMLLHDLILCSVVEIALLDIFEKNDCRSELKNPLLNNDNASINIHTESDHQRIELLAIYAEFLEGKQRLELLDWITTIKNSDLYQNTNKSEVSAFNIPGLYHKNKEVDKSKNMNDIYLDIMSVQLNPGPLCEKYGWEKVLSFISNLNVTIRIPSLAGLVSYLPEEMQESIVDEIMNEYWQYGDEDMLRSILSCSQWMSYNNAIKLLCRDLGNDMQRDFSKFLVGWGGLVDFASLLYKIGGKEVIYLTASIIKNVRKWIP